MLKSLMKKYTLLLLLLPLTTIQAQIDDEIIAYVDSTEIILNNGKKLLLDSFAKLDKAKATEIYYYLQEVAIKQGYLAFSYNEILYINLLCQNYNEWFDYIRNYENKINLPIHEVNDPFTYRLHTLTVNNSSTILANSSELNKEQQALIELFLYVVKQDQLSNGYNHLLSDFKKTYQDSKYKAFVYNYLPKAPKNESLSWYMGPAIISPSGNFGENFYTNAVFYLGVDFNFSNIYTSFYMNGGGLNVEKPFTIGENQFEKYDRFSYFDAGMQVGYRLLNTSWVQIAPYITIAGGSLRTDMYEGADYKGLEVDVMGTFIYGTGIHTLIKLYSGSTTPYSSYMNGYYTPYPIKHYFALKINGGYNILANSRYTKTKGNILYSQIGIVWGMGDF